MTKISATASFKTHAKLGKVPQVWNPPPATLEAGPGGSKVPGQPQQVGEILSQNKNKKGLGI